MNEEGKAVTALTKCTYTDKGLTYYFALVEDTEVPVIITDTIDKKEYEKWVEVYEAEQDVIDLTDEANEMSNDKPKKIK